MTNERSLRRTEPRRRAALAAGAALCAAALACASSPTPRDDGLGRVPGPLRADDPARAPHPVAQGALAELNRVARADYAQARERLLAGADPILVAGPSRLALLHAGTRDQVSIIPPGYHALKDVGHAPLGLHALLADGNLDEPRAAALQRLRAAIGRAREALGSYGFSPAQLERQQRILDATLAALDQAAATRSGAGLFAYERAVAPLLLENAREAARGQLDLIHRAVTAWRAQLGKDFARAHVVIISAHMPREGQLALQYFERLLGEREGGRIVYAEGLWDERDALALLGTHLIDGEIAQGFFGDPRRMHRDLLADAAAEYLPELLP